MNNSAIDKTMTVIMKMLKEEFGKTIDQKWDEVFVLPVNCNMTEGNAKDVWYRIENERSKVFSIFKHLKYDASQATFDRILIRSYLSEGVKNSKIWQYV